MIRRLEVVFEEEGKPPIVTLEGEDWNMRRLEIVHNALVRGLRIHKRELAKQLDRERKQQEESAKEE